MALSLRGNDLRVGDSSAGKAGAHAFLPSRTDRVGSQEHWADGDSQDGENNVEDEGEAVNEDGPTWTEGTEEEDQLCRGGNCEDDGEPSLGWTACEAAYAAYGDTISPDAEQDILDEPHDAIDEGDAEISEPDPFHPNGSHLPGGGSGI